MNKRAQPVVGARRHALTYISMLRAERWMHDDANAGVVNDLRRQRRQGLEIHVDRMVHRSHVLDWLSFAIFSREPQEQRWRMRR